MSGQNPKCEGEAEAVEREERAKEMEPARVDQAREDRDKTAAVAVASSMPETRARGLEWEVEGGRVSLELAAPPPPAAESCRRGCGR